MKKPFFRAALLGLMMMFSAAAEAQNIGDLLGNVLGGGSNASDLVSNLTSVFSSKKQATANNIVGTWSYTEPAIVFTSDNVITKAASKVAANKVEQKLQSYLTQYGIKPGAVTLTFSEDGKVKGTLNGKSVSGKWAITDSRLQLTVGGVKSPQITTQIDGKDMQFVTDATKLLTLFKTFGAKSSNSNIKTITSLMKSVNGMQAGLTLRKQ